jgi:serine/threonine protein kinase
MSIPLNRALPQGYKLDVYTLDRPISRGGFSIVYRATDPNGEMVAVKEYLPAGLVLRTDGTRVQASSAENMTSFRYGMKCFFEEGKALAAISHNNVVRVLNFFRANDTVYMVMKYERGRTLQQYIQAKQGMLPERFVRYVFTELLNGLREVHAKRLLHLDIKPANVFIRNDGSPVLLDFGAARQILASTPNVQAPMYTPGFAAPEQYKEADAGQQGPWTDIYGVGASIYACFAAFAPQSADSRVTKDHYIPAHRIWGDIYTRDLLDIVDWCLKLDPLERPQSVLQVQKLLRPLPRTENKSSLDRFKEMFRFGGKPSRLAPTSTKN